MAFPLDRYRVSETAFKVSLGTLGTLSILAVAVRYAIRVKTHHRFNLDDVLLSFGCVCFCVGSGLAYSVLHTVYLSQLVALQQDSASITSNDSMKVFSVVLVYDAVVFLTWTAEFAVKLSILSSFRILVRRLPRLTVYLWLTVGVNIFAWAFLAMLDFVTCSSAGQARLGKCDPPNSVKIRAISYTGAGMDILSDFMVLSIPIFLLWKAKMKLKQKFGLALFLTLNIWIFVISLFRAALAEVDTPNGKVFNTVWVLFWVYMEAFVSIFVASLTAVRSIFARQDSRHSRERMVATPLTFIRNDVLYRRPPIDSESLCSLSGVPPTRLPGIGSTHDSRHLAAPDQDVEAVSSLIAATSGTSNMEKVISCDGGLLERTSLHNQASSIHLV